MNRIGIEIGGLWISGGEFVLRSSLVLLTAWLLTALMRHRSASERHLVWTMSLIGVLALPMTQAFVPGWRILPAMTDAANVAPSDEFAISRSVTESRGSSSAERDSSLEQSPPTLVAAANINEEATYSEIIASQRTLQSEPAVGESSLDLFKMEKTNDSLSLSSVGEPVRTVSIVEKAQAWLGLVWLAGFAVFCLPVVLGGISVWRLRRTGLSAPSEITDELRQLANEMGCTRRMTVLLSAQREMPMTWGVFRPVLLLPTSAVSWSVERREMVALHELAHIRRWDCLTQLLGQIVRALFWFNPLAWLALRRLRVEQERSCDDIVLNFGTSATDYASELLSITARLPQQHWDTAVALAMSRTTRIEQRLRAILDADCERRPMSRSRLGVTLSLMTLVALGIAIAQPRATVAGTLIATQEALNKDNAAAQAAPSKSGDSPKTEATKNELGFENGGFEADLPLNGIPTAWHPAHLAEMTRFVKFASEDSGHSGKRSVSIAVDKNHPSQPVAYNWLAQPRGWKVGQALEVSTWVKTENVKQSPVLAVQCLSNNNRLLTLGTSEARFSVTGTKDWTRIAALVFVPNGTSRIDVRACLGMPGNGGAKVWFDDFAITEANEIEAKAASREISVAEQDAIQRATEQQQAVGAQNASTPNSSLKEALEKITATSPSPIDAKALHEAAIRGMLQSLKDPYSGLLTAEQMNEMMHQIDGKLVGIGAMLSKEAEAIVVTGLVPNSPAMRGGLKPRDVIVEINGQSAKGLPEAVKLIRGLAGTEVTIKVLRADKPESLTLKRAEVRVPSVRGLSLNDKGEWQHWLDSDQKIAFVQLAMFDKESGNDLKETLTRARDQGMKGLVLDLRGNVGGLLMSCIQVAELFLKEGTIVQVRGRNPNESQTFQVGTAATGLFADVPLIVLIDPSTASAGEVLAAALKDNNRAKLVGERTFGKGSVQSIMPLGSDGFQIKLTTALMLSPNGQSWNRATDSKSWGVDPDDGYFVPLTVEQRMARSKAVVARESGTLKLPSVATPEFLDKEAADPQLAAALKALTAKLKTGEFAKSGQPLADQQTQLSKLDELRKQRDELRQKLEQLDRELGESR